MNIRSFPFLHLLPQAVQDLEPVMIWTGFSVISLSVITVLLIILKRRRHAHQRSRPHRVSHSSIQLDLSSSPLSSNPFWKKLNELVGLSRSENQDEVRENLFEFLISCDFGYDVSQQILNALPLSQDVNQNFQKLRDILLHLLHVYTPQKELFPLEKPQGVFLLVGLNGVGKTTVSAKIAALSHQKGQKTLLVPADTFRAAAVQQLKIWAERIGTDVWNTTEKADPSSVVFQSLQHSLQNHYDTVVIDTAGRLHVDQNLMDELKKVKRVMKKVHPDFPHAILLVLDSTNGSGALDQLRAFHEALGVDGLILTKLDGLSRGGLLFHLISAYRIPVLYEGVGEKIEDLKIFRPDSFVDRLIR